MYACSVKLLGLFIIVSTTSLFSASNISKISNQPDVCIVEKIGVVQLPTLIITTIYNKTPYDILLIDRLEENSSIVLPAGKNTEVNLALDGKNEVIIKYEMPLIVANIMAKNAQYVFKKLDQNGRPECGKTSYFNLHMTGTSMKLNLKCYVANASGYFGEVNHMINGYYDQQRIECALELSMNDENIKLNFSKTHMVRAL